MRRLLIPICLLLISCVRSSDVSPEEVLRRSSAANRAFSAARFVIDAKIRTGAPEELLTMDVRADGRLQDGGRESAFSVSAEGQITTDNTLQTGMLELDAIIAAEQEVYINIRTLSIDPPHEVVSSPLFAQLQNTWLRLPLGTAVEETLTPDPRMIHMQTDIVRVVEDRGIEIVNGKPSHRLEVMIDPEKLDAFMEKIGDAQDTDADEALESWDALSFEGTLWIDERTYLLNVAEWRIVSTDEEDPLDIRFSVEITEDEETVAITPPAGAIPLPFLPFVPGENGLLFPENGVMDQNAVPLQTQEQLMESAMGNQ